MAGAGVELLVAGLVVLMAARGPGARERLAPAATNKHSGQHSRRPFPWLLTSIVRKEPASRAGVGSARIKCGTQGERQRAGAQHVNVRDPARYLTRGW
jgi:hypothetical protein